MDVMSFNDVIEHLNKEGRKRHLLLGNGFSIEYDKDIFSYNALSRFIFKSRDKLLLKLFKVVNNKNFETLMKQLDICKIIASTFSKDKSLVNKIDVASNKLKDSVILAIDEMHPEHVFKIPEDKCSACASFIKLFTNNNGHIFTTNYDILLYWILMRNNIENAIDGFGRDAITNGEYIPKEELEYSELFWGNNKDNQNIHYLHGSLPLFDDGVNIIKEEYKDDKYILENIKERIKSGQYPVFVTAGNSNEKLNHILHNPYLSYCYDNLCSIEGSLITFGFNFGEYDEHIVEAINMAAKKGRIVSNKLWSIYIGVYSENDIKHLNSIKKNFKLKVNYFDSKTAKIWN